jgi:hypothetical protein
MLLDMKNPISFCANLPRKHMIEEMGAAWARALRWRVRMYTSIADTDHVIDEALIGLNRAVER